MTTINISIKQATSAGLAPVAGGLVTFTPRRHIDADKNVITRSPFSVTLSEQGTATVELPPTAGLFVWHVVELPGTAAAYDRYVEVPDSKDPVDYADLVDVDPLTSVPAAMTGSSILKVMTAPSEAEAQTLSKQHPDYLVFYPTGASPAKAREILTSMGQLEAAAQTSAATVMSLKSQVVSDAGVVSDTTASVRSASKTVSDKQTEVIAKADEASTSIDAAVQSVTDKAAQAQDNIQKVEAGAKTDSGQHDDDSTEQTTDDSISASDGDENLEAEDTTGPSAPETVPVASGEVEEQS